MDAVVGRKVAAHICHAFGPYLEASVSTSMFFDREWMMMVNDRNTFASYRRAAHARVRYNTLEGDLVS